MIAFTNEKLKYLSIAVFFLLIAGWILILNAKGVSNLSQKELWMVVGHAIIFAASTVLALKYFQTSKYAVPAYFFVMVISVGAYWLLITTLSVFSDGSRVFFSTRVISQSGFGLLIGELAILLGAGAFRFDNRLLRLIVSGFFIVSGVSAIVYYFVIDSLIGLYKLLA